MLTRRTLLAGLLAPSEVLIDTHIHLFDPQRVPYHANAPYKPPAEPVEAYAKFAPQAGISHAIIVHPEPYQDDHRYLEYCFAQEPSPGFFKGTCLFDPLASATPARMREIVKKHPNRIAAIRVHEMHPCDKPFETTGAIKNRDLAAPAMKEVWRTARSLGLAIQMHFVPCHAPQIGELAAALPDLPVVLDHLGRPGQGTPKEWDGVMALAKLPRVYMKYSGVTYVKGDVKPLIRRIYDAFGADRIVWGGLGMNAKQFQDEDQRMKSLFDFGSPSDRAKVRGGNAAKLYRFTL